MQCKDISTIDILKYLKEKQGHWCFKSSNDEYDIRNAMPNGFQLSKKLVLAKMDKLLRKDLITGCTCGCRGDFEITQKGLNMIDQEKKCKNCGSTNIYFDRTIHYYRDEEDEIVEEGPNYYCGDCGEIYDT